MNATTVCTKIPIFSGRSGYMKGDPLFDEFMKELIIFTVIFNAGAIAGSFISCVIFLQLSYL